MQDYSSKFNANIQGKGVLIHNGDMVLLQLLITLEFHVTVMVRAYKAMANNISSASVYVWATMIHRHGLLQSFKTNSVNHLALHKYHDSWTST